jgi:hypothetical protein
MTSEDRNLESENKLTTSDIAARNTAHDQNPSESLLMESDRETYVNQWSEIQGKFVDEPKASVQEADTLVAGVIQKLATKFAEERQNLEQQWGSGGEANTEDLRQALQHYRTFFQRLLAA